MAVRERGSEVVQAVIALPLVLYLMFIVMQVGAGMLSIGWVSSDLARACRQMDTSGLVLAADKNAFVKEELLGAAGRLLPERLRVSQVSLFIETSNADSPLTQSPLTVSQRTNVSRIAFEVAYDIPDIVVIPGLSGQTISRRVECSRIDGKTVEVGVSAL